MSEAMQRQWGQMPAWLVFSGVAIGVVRVSVNKHCECRRTRGGSGQSDRQFGCSDGRCAWPPGLGVACCWRCRGASWACRDCARRPT